MTDTITKPFNQKIRIAALRASFALLVPLVVMVRPQLDDTMPGEVMEQGGVLLIVAGVLGRFWAILYIGGHKNETVMQSGPYSMCRHPLYLFSILATFGFGLMLQSVLLAILLAGNLFAILNVTASREEAFLRSRFGARYDRYAATTPRIIPDVSRFSTDNDMTFSVRHLRTNFFDALVFIFLIPLAEVVEWVRMAGIFPSVTLP